MGLLVSKLRFLEFWLLLSRVAPYYSPLQRTVWWAEHFENALKGEGIAGKEIEENKKVCDALYVSEYLFLRKS